MIEFQRLPELYKRILKILLLIGLLITFGMTGFTIIQPEHTLFDAFYMTVITLSTVGYQEVLPLSTGARAFTIVLIGIGIGCLGYSVSWITSFIVEGEIKNTFRDRKMDNTIKKLKNHIIVCGHGRLGNHAAKEILNWKQPFVVIESNRENAESLKKSGEIFCIHGNATKDAVLIKAGIQHAKGLIAALSEDVDNLFVALSARRLNKDLTIISRVEYMSSEEKLITAGADKVMSPAQIAGRRMASMLINPEVADFLDVFVDSWDLNLSLQGLHVRKGCELDGVPIKNSNLPHEIHIIGLKDENGKMEINPGGDSIINAKKTLIILGSREKIDQLRAHSGIKAST